MFVLMLGTVTFFWNVSIMTTNALITFDDTHGWGRRFDGIGGLSGGGATSKLLVNYPEKQRNEILDYLFKPNFGASLQILKVEIGGDCQSTDGTEASHMHYSWEENYERGYEWWLMSEAKQRNPNIKLYGLPWGFPGWIGFGTVSPYANISVTADYIVRWINGAKKFHNLTIDYIGIWNERSYNIDYIKLLRKVLDKGGFTETSIIIVDGGWEIATDVLTDAELASDITAIGAHYPGTVSTSAAKSTGKALWASEDYSTLNDEVGGGCWARILNQNYVNGLITLTISWNLIASYYDGLPYYRCGLMTAVQPWSGHYEVDTPIWMSAHTTQFTDIGWVYLSHGSGVGKLPKGGSYVSLSPLSKEHITIVIETMTHNHSQCIRPYLPEYTVEPQEIHLVLKGNFSHIAQMNVWYSKLGFDGQPSVLFKKRTPLKFTKGEAVLKLGLDEVYTLTTLDTGHKAIIPPSPEPAPFPAFPYKDDFEGYNMYQEPFNLVPQTGVLEVHSHQSNKFVRQMSLEMPVYSNPSDRVNKSYSVIGNSSWTDVSVDVMFSIPSTNGTTGVFVGARADRGGGYSALAQGLFFFVLKDKYIFSNDLARTKVIKEGPLNTSITFDAWHNLFLFVGNGTALAALDRQVLFRQIKVPAQPPNGFAALGTDSYGLADFDDFILYAH